MFKFFGKYAGQMAFSLIGTVLGALIVTKLGLYSPFSTAPQPAPVMETVVAPSQPAVKLIEESHQVIRDRLDADRRAAQRMAEAENRARAEAIAEAERARAAARAAQERAQERARRLAAKRDAAPAPAPLPAQDQIATASPPTNILPAISMAPPQPEPETMLDKVKGKFKSTIGKMHDFVSAAIRLDNPFEAVSPRGAPSTEQRARFSGLDL
jgi:hypothetical protein